MRNLILAAAVVVALSFASSTAMADHYRHRRSYHHHGYVPRQVVPYHAYRHVPVYAYPTHHYQGYHHNYHYARPGYYGGGGVAINGPRLSLYIGF